MSFRAWARKGLDFVLPYKCLGCGILDCEQDTLCGSCFAQLHVLSGPVCPKCSHPTHRWDEAEPTCVFCPFPYSVDATRCCVAYNDLARALVLRFKNGDTLSIARFWGRWMQRNPVFQNMWDLHNEWVAAPVPLHWWRLWLRGFNQSVELARYALPKDKNITWIPDLLKSSRWKTSQKSQRAFLRMQQPSPFSINPKYDVSGKAVWLWDDVVTTGSTVHQCAETLKNAGARFVVVGAIARTLRPNWNERRR
jgi:ComF family protein